MQEIDPEDLDDPQVLAIQEAVLARLAKIARDELAAVERQKKDKRNAYQREYYARNREQLQEDQRRMRQERKAADPIAFNAQARARTKRWRDSHKAEENEKQRDKYAADPTPQRERRRVFYARNADRLREKRRERYAATRDAINQAARDRRAAAKARYDAGIPSGRVAHVPIDVAHRRLVDAETFFTRPRTADEVAAIRRESATPPELLQRFAKDCTRARAAHALHTRVEELARINRVLGMKPYAVNRPSAREIEEMRMDAIASEINLRFRLASPSRGARLDPAAPRPTTDLTTATNGMNR